LAAMKNRVMTVLLAGLVLWVGGLWAEEVAVTAAINADKIGLDDVLVYTLTFKGIENPRQPDLSNLPQLKVTQISRGFRQEFINGAHSSYVDFTYYLQPQATGAFTIPPLSYEYQGRAYKTEAFTIQVVQGSVVPRSSPGRKSIFDLDDDFFSSPFDRVERKPQEIDVKLRAVASKKDVLPGEQVIYKVLLYTRNNIESINMVSNQTIPGFWQEWYPVPQTIDGTVASLDGKNYRLYEIRKAALFPTNAGQVSIPPLKFELILRQDAFSFFSNGRNIFRSTPEVTLNVRPLPAQAAGLPVGDFDFSVTPAQAAIDINEILTLKSRISGKGNLKTLETPNFESGDDYRVFPARITRHTDFGQGELTGVLEAELPVTFKKAGLIAFPALSLTFYQPEMRQIVTRQSKPFTVKVSGKKEESESGSTIPQTEIVKTGQDIDYIKKGRIYDQEKLFYKTPLFQFLAVIFFLVNLIYLLKITLYDKYISQNPLLNRKKLLNRTVKALLSVRDYGEIFPILENYVKEKGKLGRAEINSYAIENLFEKYGISGKDGKNFTRIKAESESCRFSPIKKTAQEFKHDLQLLVDIVKRIDRKIK